MALKPLVLAIATTCCHVAGIRRYVRASRIGSLEMPAHHRLRPDVGKCIGYLETIYSPRPKPISRWPRMTPAYPTPVQHNDLLPKHQNLSFQRLP